MKPSRRVQQRRSDVPGLLLLSHLLLLWGNHAHTWHFTMSFLQNVVNDKYTRLHTLISYLLLVRSSVRWYCSAIPYVTPLAEQPGQPSSTAVFSPEFWNRGCRRGKVQSTSLKSIPYPLWVLQLIAVYLHVYNCLVIIIEYRSTLHAIILMGGAAASKTLIGGYIWTIGGCSPPQEQPRENTAWLCQKGVGMSVHRLQGTVLVKQSLGKPVTTSRTRRSHGLTHCQSRACLQSDNICH